MLSILLDEGLPWRAAQWLRDHGVDALHTRELGLASATDAKILMRASLEHRTCVTLDHDFHAILAETGASTPSVILIRTQQTSYEETGKLILKLLAEVSNHLEAGVAITATRRGIRLRHLPLR
jgi:predicted nuclease of predicted toxin-antitoxin system